MAVAAKAVRRPRLRRVRGVLWWLVVIGLTCAWAVYLRPTSLGGPAGFVIVSGESMEPMMHTGDLAVVRRQSDYNVGDVVAYRIPQDDVGGGHMVIHRVVGGDVDDGLVLKGDNRDTEDMWRPKRDDVVGTLLWHIPHAGTALFLLRTPLVLAGVTGFLGFWVVATWSRKKPEESDEGSGAEAVGEEPSPAPPVPAVVPGRFLPARPGAGAASTGTAAAVGVMVLSAAAYARQSRRRRRAGQA